MGIGRECLVLMSKILQKRCVLNDFPLKMDITQKIIYPMPKFISFWALDEKEITNVQNSNDFKLS